MKGIGFVLFIIAVQVISAIIAQRKKQAEKKAREEAARRAMAGAPTMPGTPPRPGQPIGGASPSASTSPDLEDRRREQLEQLRQRRESRRGKVATSQPGQLRTGSVPPTRMPQRSGPMAITTASIGTSDQARSKAQEAQRRAREAERVRRDEQSRAVMERAEAQEKVERLSYEREFHRVAGEEDQATHTAAVERGGQAAGAALALSRSVGSGGAADRAGAAAVALVNRLRSPASIRELIVLREVVDRPLSLRD